MADHTRDDEPAAPPAARPRARLRVAEVQVYDRVPGQGRKAEAASEPTAGSPADTDALIPEPVTRTRVWLARLREIALGAAQARGDASVAAQPAAPTRVSLERLRERARGGAPAAAPAPRAALPADPAARLRERIKARAAASRPRGDETPDAPCSDS